MAVPLTWDGSPCPFGDAFAAPVLRTLRGLAWLTWSLLAWLFLTRLRWRDTLAQVRKSEARCSWIDITRGISASATSRDRSPGAWPRPRRARPSELMRVFRK